MTKKSFDTDEMKAFEPCEKIGIISCVNPDGQTHMSLITSIMASTPNQMTLGQFSRGLSKWFIQQNSKLSYVIITLDKNMWRGTAKWTHRKFDGPEYEVYNDMPMFRYNSYFGINTVHYLDLVENFGKESLPMLSIVPSILLTKLAKGGAKTKSKDRILSHLGEDLFNQLDALKFISYVGDDGFPVIIPIIQCQTPDSRRLAFSNIAYGSELKALKPGTNVSVFALNTKMQSVLTRGTFNGFTKHRLVEMGTVDIDWVYNSIPPIHEQIYPAVELKAVEKF